MGIDVPTFENEHVTADRWRNGQYGAAFFVFAHVRRAFDYVHEGGIGKKELLDATCAWSHGEQILVKVALDLFDPGCVIENGYAPAHVGEIAGILDGRNMGVVITAIRIARGEIRALDVISERKS